MPHWNSNGKKNHRDVDDKPGGNVYHDRPEGW
jgi:hypothetical protein